MKKRPGSAAARSAPSSHASTEPAHAWQNCSMSTARKISALTKRLARCSQAAANNTVCSFIPIAQRSYGQTAADPARPKSYRACRTHTTLTNATVQLVAHAPNRRSPKLQTEQSRRKKQSSQLQRRPLRSRRSQAMQQQAQQSEMLRPNPTWRSSTSNAAWEPPVEATLRPVQTFQCVPLADKRVSPAACPTARWK